MTDEKEVVGEVEEKSNMKWFILGGVVLYLYFNPEIVDTFKEKIKSENPS